MYNLLLEGKIDHKDRKKKRRGKKIKERLNARLTGCVLAIRPTIVTLSLLSSRALSWIMTNKQVAAASRPCLLPCFLFFSLFVLLRKPQTNHSLPHTMTSKTYCPWIPLPWCTLSFVHGFTLCYDEVLAAVQCANNRPWVQSWSIITDNETTMPQPGLTRQPRTPSVWR